MSVVDGTRSMHARRGMPGGTGKTKKEQVDGSPLGHPPGQGDRVSMNKTSVFSVMGVFVRTLFGRHRLSPLFSEALARLVRCLGVLPLPNRWNKSSMSHTAVVIVIKWKHRSVFWSYLPLIFLHFVRHVNNAAAFSISPLLDSPLTVFDKRWGGIYIFSVLRIGAIRAPSFLPAWRIARSPSLPPPLKTERAMASWDEDTGHVWGAFRFGWKGGRGPHETSACGKYGRSAVFRQGGHLDQHRPKKIARRQRGPSKDGTVAGKRTRLSSHGGCLGDGAGR